MRKLLLWSVGAIVLCLAVPNSLAQEQGQDQRQRKISRQEVPAVARAVVQDPNRLAESNEQAGPADQQEQYRRLSRERIRERAKERSLQATGGRAGRGLAADANAPAGAKGRGEPNAKGRDELAGKAIARGARRQQQLTAIEQQVSHEEDKHLDRLARLKRIRELAQQQGDAEAVARVDKLLGQEQQRYDAKTQRMTHRKDRIVEFSQKAAPDKSKKAAGADVNKDSNQPEAENE